VKLNTSDNMAIEKRNNEVYTPDWYLKKLDDKFNWVEDFIIDPYCGEGVWLKYAQDKGCSNIWGCDIEEESCKKTITNLYGEGKIETLTGEDIPEPFRGDGVIAVFKHNDKLIKNIVQADSSKYAMNFGEELQPITFGQGLFDEL
jgi:hypothetical protein